MYACCVALESNHSFGLWDRYATITTRPQYETLRWYHGRDTNKRNYHFYSEHELTFVYDINVKALSRHSAEPYMLGSFSLPFERCVLFCLVAFAFCLVDCTPDLPTQVNYATRSRSANKETNERATRLELATFSLEGWHSTNWAIPAKKIVFPISQSISHDVDVFSISQQFNDII